MKTSICHKNGHLPQINQEEVNRFYQQRQISKKNLNPHISVVTRNQNSQNESFNHTSFKNLYRRKSMMHKLKEEESMFTSFNNSVDYDKPLSQSILRKSTHRTVYEHTLNNQHILKSNSNQENFQIIPKISQNHCSIQQHGQSLYDSESSEFFVNRLKKRSKSVQLQSNSASFYGTRQQKGTIPLSTILKKYQEEVNKLEQQDRVGEESEKMSFSKVQLQERGQKIKSDENKQNYQTFNPSAQFKRQSNIDVKPENCLPEVVEKCIDKWRDLQLDQIRENRRYNKKKQLNKKDSINDQMPSQTVREAGSAKEQTQYNQQSQGSKTNQYDRILKQKEEYIKQLEKQNNQYKKFVQSILKMKTTLDQFQSLNPNNQITDKIYTQLNPNEPEANLKQLWRWIKSLPTKKSHQTKKEYLR